ncbi:MAG TPA: sigma-70 family RNA polymerase sigma factor [Ktedonobacterales bacterium]|nr:sigma-70 family RNA polymerase sigma factor [Ktedonobacterales bacterium]
MPPKSTDTIRQPAPGSSDSRAHIVHLPGRRDTLTISEQALPPTPTDAERALILRICLHATHNRDVAEDLAQETLLEAWRHWRKLREPDDSHARARWLSAIAGNVCRRWGRRAGRDLAHTTRLTTLGEGAEPGDNMELRADEGDALDTELEHAERAQLLDRALGLLPPDTREALIARYLLELPLGDIAARHGLSEATLSVRLHRGKRMLRQLLATTLREEALAYGLLPVTDVGWQETRIWCPQCGTARLQGQLGGSPARLRLRCPRCARSRSGLTSQDDFIDHVGSQGILDGVKTFKAALNRVGAWANSYYRAGAVAREVLCRCGRIVPFAPMRRGEYRLSASCSCHAQNHANIAGIALSTAEARRFWRAQPRIHLLPYREIEMGGRDAIVIRYEAVGGGAQLDTLFARESYELLSIHQTPGI